MTAARRGVVLMIALLILLALTLATAGLLFLSTQELRIARARGELLRARLAAESAARAALAAWRTSDHRDLRPGESRGLAVPGLSGARSSVVVERLTPGLFLLRAEALVGDTGRAAARAGVGLLVRALDPREILADFPAALTTGGGLELTGATVDGLIAGTPPPAWPDSLCSLEATEAVAELFGAVPRPGLLVADPAAVRVSGGATVAGDPPIARDSALAAAAFDRLGPLTWELIERMADRIETGIVSLRPAAGDGACRTDEPGNWGDPIEPGSPCGSFFPLVFAPGDLEVPTGAGQAALAVGGDLRLGPGVQLYGPVLVRGRLIASDSARVFGAIRAAGRADPSLLTAAAISYSACALWRALAQSPALSRPFRPAGRAWIPVF
ncbi:MAG: hypothetical protein HY561_03075 [Gemmatimonadetes bacterium]|nr:hypothetical protein [Gemmatimonadota bacterium]